MSLLSLVCDSICTVIHHSDATDANSSSLFARVPLANSFTVTLMYFFFYQINYCIVPVKVAVMAVEVATRHQGRQHKTPPSTAQPRCSIRLFLQPAITSSTILARSELHHRRPRRRHEYSLTCVTRNGPPTHSHLAVQLKVTTAVDLCQ